MFRQKQVQGELEDVEQILQEYIPLDSQPENHDPNKSSSLVSQNYDQEEVVNLIKYAQDLKNKGKIEMALKEMEKTLDNPELKRDLE